MSFAYGRIVDDNGPLESLKQDSMKADGLVELDRGWLTGWSFNLNNSIVTSQTQQGTELRLFCMDYDKWEIQFSIVQHYFAEWLDLSHQMANAYICNVWINE